MSKSENSKSDATPYKPTDREDAVIARFVIRKNTEPTAPNIKIINRGNSVAFAPNHPDEATGFTLLMEALGTADVDFVYGLLEQLVNASSHGRKASENALNFVLSVIKGIKPKDQLEAMLAAQMAVTHMTAMKFTERLTNAANIEQQDSAERALNKLMRTFAGQMEALKRYRTGGEQKVTVQYVSVNEGGQAIVGNVTQATREASTDKPSNSALALTNSQPAEMPLISEQEQVPPRRTRNGKRSSP